MATTPEGPGLSDIQRNIVIRVKNNKGEYVSNKTVVINIYSSKEGVLGIQQSTYTKTTDSNGLISFTATISNVSSINGIEVYSEEDDVYFASEEIILDEQTLWAPALDGTTGADYAWSYSESDGEAIGKGFVLHNGFDNVEKWELSFEFRHDNIQYTGICFLAKLGEYNGKGENSNALTTWEGSWPGGTNYATFSSGTIDWFDVKVTKIDSTHVRLQSTKLDRDTTVEITWLPTATKLSCGARHNTTNLFGPCRIRNVQALKIV